MWVTSADKSQCFLELVLRLCSAGATCQISWPEKVQAPDRILYPLGSGVGCYGRMFFRTRHATFAVLTDSQLMLIGLMSLRNHTLFVQFHPVACE